VLKGLPRPSYPNFSFEIKHKDSQSKARTGNLTTPHGSVETPAFIFCGTKASVKGLTPQQLRDAGTQIILSNTYHVSDQGMCLTCWRASLIDPLLVDPGPCSCSSSRAAS
jgi:hypothetical protein